MASGRQPECSPTQNRWLTGLAGGATVFDIVATIAARGSTDTVGHTCLKPIGPARPAGGRRWIGRIVAVVVDAAKAESAVLARKEG
jgi:hypothetical protein